MKCMISLMNFLLDIEDRKIKMSFRFFFFFFFPSLYLLLSVQLVSMTISADFRY